MCARPSEHGHHGHHVQMYRDIVGNISTFIISLDYALTRCALRFFDSFVVLLLHFDCLAVESLNLNVGVRT